MRQNVMKSFLSFFNLYDVTTGLDPFEDGVEDDLLFTVVDL